MFFRWWRFYRKALDTFTYFFVQNRVQKVVQQLGKTNVVVSGDTRFDRVAAIIDKDSTRLYFAVQKRF
jgi:3-deoxy-D-manno-octulosonic-acid transferase